MPTVSEIVEPTTTEYWWVLGHPGWPGGIDFRSQKAAEDFYWRTPKLDGTHDGMTIARRTIVRYPAYVPENTRTSEEIWTHDASPEDVHEHHWTAAYDDQGHSWWECSCGEEKD